MQDPLQFNGQVHDFKSKDHQSMGDRGGKYVTIFTDASYCPLTKATGWGIWIKFGLNGSTYRESGGYISQGEQGSHYAELFALNKAVAHCVESDDISVEGKIVIIQSDCQGALNNLNIRVLHSLEALKVIKRWVKGHKGTDNKRSAVNTWCDRAAGIEMRKIRETITADE